MAPDLNQVEHPDPTAAARDLLPLIRAHADETERGRKLAAPVLDALRSSGLFSMGVPAALGGREIPIAKVLRAVEEIELRRRRNRLERNDRVRQRPDGGPPRCSPRPRPHRLDSARYHRRKHSTDRPHAAD